MLCIQVFLILAVIEYSKSVLLSKTYNLCCCLVFITFVVIQDYNLCCYRGFITFVVIEYLKSVLLSSIYNLCWFKQNLFLI